MIDTVDPTIPEKRPKTNIKRQSIKLPKRKSQSLNDIIQSLN